MLAHLFFVLLGMVALFGVAVGIGGEPVGWAVGLPAGGVVYWYLTRRYVPTWRE